MASDDQNELDNTPRYIHVDYLPSSGWVLTP